ncbi:hypothetical protein FGB62_1g244 [Gracilaria domingensis]|nr:hypothetical protein FGB62_1g244 [Gracilaria domingensis]
MHATFRVLRAAQAMASPDASRIVSEAAKRASQRRKRPRGLRKYSDLIVVGLATVVAATAVKNKHAYEETREKMELRIEQLEEERDVALTEIDRTQQRLLTAVQEGVDVARRNGGQGLHNWIKSAFNEPCLQEGETREKPSVI